MPKPKTPKTLEDTHKFVKAVSNHKGWKLNPNEEFVGTIVDGLMTNYNRYGYFLCPCRDTDGIKDKDIDLTCPCSYTVADQEEFGQCFCGLYLSEEFFNSEKKPVAIPERRPDELWDD